MYTYYETDREYVIIDWNDNVIRRVSSEDVARRDVATLNRLYKERLHRERKNKSSKV